LEEEVASTDSVYDHQKKENGDDWDHDETDFWNPWIFFTGRFAKAEGLLSGKWKFGRSLAVAASLEAHAPVALDS
jgi:hypothetical protein